MKIKLHVAEFDEYEEAEISRGNDLEYFATPRYEEPTWRVNISSHDRCLNIYARAVTTDIDSNEPEFMRRTANVSFTVPELEKIIKEALKAGILDWANILSEIPQVREALRLINEAHRQLAPASGTPRSASTVAT